MKIRVYPIFRAEYYSFYLQGLKEVFGAGALYYSCHGFPRLPQHCLALIFEPQLSKVYIDARDAGTLIEEGLAWADIYAKINVDPETLSHPQAAKILPIGPAFGSQLCGPIPAVWHALRNYLIGRTHLVTPREFFAGWRSQYKFRLTETAYTPEPSSPNYVFFSSSIWKEEPQCNQYRARFIEACRSFSWLEFEGGFAPRTRNDVPGFEKYTTERRYPVAEWLSRMKRSAVAFNTPAVFSCLSWRLGEVLALGKAIIGTPHARLLPVPLVHGKNMHFVDGSLESIKDAIARICRDGDYRKRLEEGARTYYVSYLRPRRVIERIMVLAWGQAERKAQTPALRSAVG
jgi:hypothetical protein